MLQVGGGLTRFKGYTIIRDEMVRLADNFQELQGEAKSRGGNHYSRT